MKYLNILILTLMSLCGNQVYAQSNLGSTIEIIGDSIVGGISIVNVDGDGISIIDTLGNTTDGVQVVNPNDDGIFIFSAGDDGFQSTNAAGDGFFSQAAGDDGFHAAASNGDGIFITNSTGFAGYFGGDVEITGSLSKAAGSFKIDHPLDPENKILYHSFVESPDMMNIYNGNVILNKNGSATINLPDWFCKLNKDYRYQLTCIGGFAQVYIATKVENNTFTIAGGVQDLEVSWLITGIRNDAYAQKNRIPVEVEKEEKFKGAYLQPEAYNLPYTKSYDYIKTQNKIENPK